MVSTYSTPIGKDVEDLIKEVIASKTKKAKEHREIAHRALERYKKHTHAQAYLEDEIMKLEASLVMRALKKAG